MEPLHDAKLKKKKKNCQKLCKLFVPRLAQPDIRNSILVAKLELESSILIQFPAVETGVFFESLQDKLPFVQGRLCFSGHLESVRLEPATRMPVVINTGMDVIVVVSRFGLGEVYIYMSFSAICARQFFRPFLPGGQGLLQGLAVLLVTCSMYHGSLFFPCILAHLSQKPQTQRSHGAVSNLPKQTK